MATASPTTSPGKRDAAAAAATATDDEEGGPSAAAAAAQPVRGLVRVAAVPEGPFLLYRHLPSDRDVKRSKRSCAAAGGREADADDEVDGEGTGGGDSNADNNGDGDGDVDAGALLRQSSSESPQSSSSESSAHGLPPEAMDAPFLTVEAGLTELASLSDREVRAARADVFGSAVDDANDGGGYCYSFGDRMDHAVDELETEMRRLCSAADDGAADGRRRRGGGGVDGAPGDRDRSAAEALQRARRASPFLAASSHARQFLIHEDMDAARAARRMARYCEKRELMHVGPEDPAGAAAAALPLPDEEIARIAIQWDFTPKKRSGDGGAQDGATMDEETRRAATKILREWEARKFDEFDAEVERNSASSSSFRAGAVLVDARSRDPEEVYAVSQRRLFLRFAGYDPRAAARRMANYWDTKYCLFGREHALERLALNDEECPEMSQGVFYLLPGTDAFGRAIICYKFTKLPPGSDSAALKRVHQVAWYVLHLAMANKEARRNGVVLLVDMNGFSTRHFTTLDFIQRMGVLLFQSVPIRIRATHCCMPPESWWFRIALSVAMRAIGREGRSRVLFHRGSEEDVGKALEDSHGIAREGLPSALGGTLDPSYVENWASEYAVAASDGAS